MFLRCSFWYFILFTIRIQINKAYLEAVVLAVDYLLHLDTVVGGVQGRVGGMKGKRDEGRGM